MARFILPLVLAVLATPAIAGPCAIPTTIAIPLTKSQAIVAPDGGVLVTLSWGGGGGGRSHDLEQKGWRFKVGATRVAPAIKVLAPGLAVYALPDGGDVASAGTVTLVDDNGKDLVTVKRAPAKLAELPAPTVKTIVHTVHVSTGPRGGESRTNVVHLASPPPTGVAAMILYGAGKAVSSVSFSGDPRETELVAYQSPGRCGIHIPGMMEVPAGSRASIAWVDSSGRVSARSKEVVVARRKP